MKLLVDYCPETDTLSMWSGTPASSGADLPDNFMVDLDSEGEAVGFTLERASEILLPHLEDSIAPVEVNDSLAKNRL